MARRGFRSVASLDCGLPTPVFRYGALEGRRGNRSWGICPSFHLGRSCGCFHGTNASLRRSACFCPECPHALKLSVYRSPTPAGSRHKSSPAISLPAHVVTCRGPRASPACFSCVVSSMQLRERQKRAGIIWGKQWGARLRSQT